MRSRGGTVARQSVLGKYVIPQFWATGPEKNLASPSRARPGARFHAPVRSGCSGTHSQHPALDDSCFGVERPTEQSPLILTGECCSKGQRIRTAFPDPGSRRINIRPFWRQQCLAARNAAAGSHRQGPAASCLCKWERTLRLPCLQGRACIQGWVVGLSLGCGYEGHPDNRTGRERSDTVAVPGDNRRHLIRVAARRAGLGALHPDILPGHTGFNPSTILFPLPLLGTRTSTVMEF